MYGLLSKLYLLDLFETFWVVDTKGGKYCISAIYYENSEVLGMIFSTFSREIIFSLALCSHRILSFGGENVLCGGQKETLPI